MSREFHICDVLSITDGRLLSPTHIDGVYDILGYLTGEPLMTHQLPAASDAVKPRILDRYPWLDDVDIPDFEGRSSAECERLAATFADYADARYGRIKLDPVEYAYTPNGPLGLLDIAEMRRRSEVTDG